MTSGVRFNAEGAGAIPHGDAAVPKNPVLVAVGWAIFGLVVVAVVVGVLFIARDFIGHHTGWHILGATRK